MSRILLLARELPYPPNAGDRVVTYGVLRALAERGHDVHVLAYERDGDYAHAGALAKLTTSVERVVSADARLAPPIRKLSRYVRGQSDVMEMFDSEALRAAVAASVRDLSPDVVLAQHPYVGQVFRDPQVTDAIGAVGARTVTNAHVVEYAAHERQREYTDSVGTRAELAFEIPRLRAAEIAVYEASDRTLVLGEEDRRELVSRGVDPVDVQRVPLEVERYTAADPDEAVSGRLLFFGSYDWFPNVDGITWFCEDVLPTVREAHPDVELLVAGRGAPESVRELGDLRNVEFRGEVEDLASLVRTASAVVAPLQVGGGVRIKVLESMAWGVPVVTTPQGFEGVAADPGTDLLVADGASALAEEIVGLLGDRGRRRELAGNARETVRERYGLDAVADELERNLGLRAVQRAPEPTS